MPQNKTFPCVEPGCDKTVTYVPQVVHGPLIAKMEQPKSVFLTCAKKHTNEYFLE